MNKIMILAIVGLVLTTAVTAVMAEARSPKSFKTCNECLAYYGQECIEQGLSYTGQCYYNILPNGKTKLYGCDVKCY